MSKFNVPQRTSVNSLNSVDECCSKLEELRQEAKVQLNTIRSAGEKLIIARFRQGLVADRALSLDGSDNYGESIIDTLSLAAGMSRSNMYKCLKFARHPQFKGSESRLKKWIDDKREEKGSVTWSYCRNWARKSLKSPDDDKSQEEKLLDRTEKLERKAAKLEQEASELEEEAMSSSAESGWEAAGVAYKTREVANDLKKQTKRLKESAEGKAAGRVESDEYLDFVRSKPCLICSNKADAHHIETGGTGTKGHDLYTLPLCRKHHSTLHSQGQATFFNNHSIDPWKEVSLLLGSYIAGIDL